MPDRLPSREVIEEQRREVFALLTEFALKVREMGLQTVWPAKSIFPNEYIINREGGMLHSSELVCEDPPFWRYRGDHIKKVGSYGPYQDTERVRMSKVFPLKDLPVSATPFPDVLRQRLHQLLLTGHQF